MEKTTVRAGGPPEKERSILSFELQKDAAERLLIAAHRGVSGGNIPCNTIAAYEIALAQGADIIEVDVAKSADGTLWILHGDAAQARPGEPVPEGERSLGRMRDAEIRELRCLNADGRPTQYPLCTFDEVLDRFKGRCYINVDKFWEAPEKVAAAVRAHGMTDQIIVKAWPEPENLDMVEAFAPDVCFFPILLEEPGTVHEELLKRKLRYVGCEVFFRDDMAGAASEDFIAGLHADGKLVWVNALVTNHLKQIAGGHSDDTSLTVSPDAGWGWLADRGFDVIQTDWLLPMSLYLEKTGRRYRKR